MNKKINSSKNTIEVAISRDSLIVDTKREAKLLHRTKKKTEPNYTLMVCQNIIAIKKGYQDWFDLYHSVKKKIEHSFAIKLLQTPLSLLDHIFYEACREKASDIHLELRHDDTRVRFRVNGEMHYFNTFSRKELFDDMVKFFNEVDMNQSNRLISCTGSHSVNNQTFRYRMQTVPAYDKDYNDCMDTVIKILYHNNHQHVDLVTLGYLPSQIETLNKLLSSQGGSIYIAGPTGSGKTTSLYALCDNYSQNFRKKVFTIGMDFEIQRKNFTQIQVPYVESKILDYMPAMQSSINSKASMVALEELRDRSGMEVIHAGHNAKVKMITTLNASTATGIIRRLMNFDDLYKKLAGSKMINGLICQRLVPCVCKHCSINLENYVSQPKENIVNNEWLELWKNLKNLFPNQNLSYVYVRNADGCHHCKFGIERRTVVAEIIELNDELHKYVINGDLETMKKAWRNSSDGDIASGNHIGKTIIENCLYKVLNGTIGLDDFENNFAYFQHMQS